MPTERLLCSPGWVVMESGRHGRSMKTLTNGLASVGAARLQDGDHKISEAIVGNSW